MSRVAVIGGGITGLTTALTLFHHDVDVALFEATDRVGGKILTTPVAGVRVDAGPDAFLVREPHVTDLCEQLNLTPDLVAPTTGAASIWHRGALRPLPRRQYLGVPLDLDELATTGLLSDEGLARAASDLQRGPDAPAGDETVGALIRRRLGDEVMDRLVGPLLGGINAGDPDQLSLQAGVPQLAAAAAHDPSLIRSIQQHLAGTPRDPDAPIFLTHPNGVAQIVEAMHTRIADRTHLSHPVERLVRAGARWELIGIADLQFDAVVLTIPAFAAGRVLEDVAPGTAEMLGDIRYAGVVMATFAFPSDAMPAFDGSGFLVARGEGLLMTACSWASSKWAHLSDGPVSYLRVSAGHADDHRALDMDDEALVGRLLDELGWVVGVDTEPREVRITRWPRSFPQYAPGHLDRVAGIEAMLAEEAPGVIVAGAAYRGLGLPACVHQARRAAHQVGTVLGLQPAVSVDAAGIDPGHTGFTSSDS